ncbi:GNAT family N-acetyltransferase (plasmid) [Rubrobacter tropicus]|uniref:GNAT family N-acetyltransferase n=1 Tax=Rubrobacter tropicus TaxID=2653851 RepID=A0A6G8QGI3_9ACTN|nr:GNAT family N-acetyltransferase [Rubrobacter tropicus]
MLELSGHPELLAGVNELRARVYPDHPEARDARRHAEVWGWLGRHPLAREMRRWVLATGEGQVVGHLASLPQRYRIAGKRVVAHTTADYQVLPGYGFHAVSLMRRFFRTAENCVSADQVAGAMAVQRRFGAEVAGSLRYEAKLLDPSRIPRVPAPLRPLLAPARWGLRALDATLPSVFGRGPKVDVLDGFDASFDDLFERVAASVPCAPERDAAFLRWRYGTGSPPYPVTVLGVREAGSASGTLLGYAVLRVGDDGQNGYVLDLTASPGRDDVAWSLLREAVRFFGRAGVYVVRYRFATSPTSPQPRDLRGLGFFSRPRRAHTLMVRFADRGLHETALDAANWSYTTGDGEAGFWVS